jgi:hypothetical protein
MVRGNYFVWLAQKQDQRFVTSEQVPALAAIKCDFPFPR